MRGAGEIGALYARIFEGTARVRVELWDIVRYVVPGVVVFAGRERGTYERDGRAESLDIRTTRIFRYVDGQGWRQLHHHGSIDDPDRLARYQRAVRDAQTDSAWRVRRDTAPARESDGAHGGV